MRRISGEALPDLLVVAIDANCASFATAQKTIRENLLDEFRHRAVGATPDPHIERWFLDDLQAFHEVVGITPKLGRRKCKRDVYKQLLADAVVQAGHPPTLGGIEFARELAEAIDYHRVSKIDNSLGHFPKEVAARIRSL